MKETILSIFGFIICAPILFWLIKTLIIDVIKDTYKDSYKETTKDKAKAILKSMGNGIIMIAILALVGMCCYNPDKNDSNDHYDEYRNEPGW